MIFEKHAHIIYHKRGIFNKPPNWNLIVTWDICMGYEFDIELILQYLKRV